MSAFTVCMISKENVKQEWALMHIIIVYDVGDDTTVARSTKPKIWQAHTIRMPVKV